MLLPQHKISTPIRVVYERTFCHSSFGPSLSATFKITLCNFVRLSTHNTLCHSSSHKAKLKPGSSLLSHGETPHYHRRYGVSLLSSAWGQVGPPRYPRQANSFHPDRYARPRFPGPHNHQNQSVQQAESLSHLSHQNTFGVVRLSRSVH